MARILFYIVILAAGGVIAFVVAEAYLNVRQPGDIALEGPYALRHRNEECDLGAQILGLPVRDLIVGAVTTMFGMFMQAVIGARISGRS